MKKGYILRNRILTSLMGVLLAFSLGSCKSIFEDMDSCPDVGIWVRAVLPASSGFTASPDDIESVRMYVFDQNENLLQIYDAEYEEVVYFDYPNRDLNVVMFANVKDRSLNEKMTISDPAIGGHRNLGKFSITQASDFGDGVSKIATSNAPGDIFVGERYITVAEAKPMAYQTFDIPMYRATSGVFVRVYGLTEHGPTTGGWLGPFTAVVEAELDQIDFYLNSTKSNPLSSIYYRTLTHSPAPLKDDILEFPDATGRRYVNVLTPNPNTATRVKLKLYNGGNRFYTLDDIGGSPILAYSDKMCVIEIYFKNIPGQGGQVDVKVSHAQWHEEPPIDKEF